MALHLDIAAVQEWLTLLHLDCAGYSVVSSTGNWVGRSFKIDDPNYVDNVCAYVKELDRQGKQGIYLRVPTLDAPPDKHRRGAAVRSQSLSAFWLDMDIDGPGHKPGKRRKGEPAPLPLPPDERTCREIVTASGLPDPTLWIHSGGGLYPIWLFDKPIDLTTPGAFEQWTNIHQQWHAVVSRTAAARGLRVDTETYDFARVLRIPGTVNRKVKGSPTRARFFHPEVSGGLLRPQDVTGWLTIAAQQWPAPAPAQPKGTPRPATPPPAGEVRVGDDYNNRVNVWNDILEPAGWQYHSTTVGGGIAITRPGKEVHAGSSATVNVGGSNKVYVFSSSTELPTHEPLSPFAVYAYLEHGGNFGAATKALAAAGFGTQRTYKPPAAGDGIIPARSGFVDVPPPGEAAGDPVPDGEPERQLVVRNLEFVKPKKVRWLYNELIPMGAMTLLAGRESIGKSTISYDLAARVTRGTLEGNFFGTPQTVAVIGTEEDLEAMIVPRLIAAGADMSRVRQIEALEADGSFGTVSLPKDVERLRRVVEAEDIKFILVDPIMSLIHASLDTHKDRDVRQALEPLVRFASSTGVAVMGLIHVNKSNTSDPLNSIMGSRAFSAVVRSVLYCITDPDAPEGEPAYLFGHAKSNLGPKQPSRQYRITTHYVPIPGEDDEVKTSKILWGDIDDRTIEEIMETPKAERALGEVAQKLLEWLEGQGKAVQFTDVRMAFADTPEGTLRMNLSRLAAKGKIDNSTRGHYVAITSPQRATVRRAPVAQRGTWSDDRTEPAEPKTTHQWWVDARRPEHKDCDECYALQPGATPHGWDETTGTAKHPGCGDCWALSEVPAGEG